MFLQVYWFWDADARDSGGNYAKLYAPPHSCPSGQIFERAGHFF